MLAGLCWWEAWFRSSVTQIIDADGREATTRHQGWSVVLSRDIDQRGLQDL
jgi:hypothetical protein